ncbi:MAG: hypothetical protein E6G54_00650 [Actinobacteria bacterium]|nr:MAG: hypothetical protein E6G54_00650 [Actinomycetota bacterium]
METTRKPPNTDLDTTPPAPGDLELVRGFVSLHDHVEGTRDSVPPSLETVEWWLREHGLLTVDRTPEEADLRWAAGILEALRSRVHENMGRSPDPGSIDTLDRAARETELSVDAPCSGIARRIAPVAGAR